MTVTIGRRELLAALGGAAVAWPLAARAQQPSRMRRIGVLMGLSESDPEAQSRIAAFRKTLQGLGWTEGRNVQADYYWAAGDVERTHALAKELVSSAPDVIVVNTPPGLSALRVETHTIPIVFVQVALADHHRLPAVYPLRFFATGGGLMAYGADLVELLRLSASYVDRILRGAHPSDLPVQSSTKFELIINLKTAKALGLEVPPILLARADEVIE